MDMDDFIKACFWLMKFKVPEKCKDCQGFNAMMGARYCRIKAVDPNVSQMDATTIFVDPDSRPEWCPIYNFSLKNLNNEEKLND